MFPVDFCGQCAIVLSCDVCVQEGNRVFFLLFHSELHTGVYSIEATPELLSRVAARLVAAAVAWASMRSGRLDDTPYIIHVDEYMARDRKEALPGKVYGAVHGMCHP